MLQFITNGTSSVSLESQVKGVLDGGCKWIQLRMKDAEELDMRKAVEKIQPLCKEYDAFCVLNDNVALAKELNLDGVHVGKSDMPPLQARNMLGAEPMLGVTVNTIADIVAVSSLDIDYFGVGPYRFTQTKANLAPILDITGYKNIIAEMNRIGIEIPIVAVGGITIDDVDILMDAGVNGIAVSSDIVNSSSIEKKTKEYIDRLSRYRKV